MEMNKTIGIMDVSMAKKIVKYVKEHPNATWSDVENSVPGLRNNPELRDYAVEGCPLEKGFLVKINADGTVSLGPVAYLIDSL